MNRNAHTDHSNSGERTDQVDFVQISVSSESTELVANPQGLISQIRPTAADQHPAAVYLSHLAPGSRRTMRGALDTMAGLLTAHRFDMQTLDWSALRYQHTTALRTILADLYAPATANKMLAALRGVLQEAWRLGKMSAEEYPPCSRPAGCTRQHLPRGRAVSRPELVGLFKACELIKGRLVGVTPRFWQCCTIAGYAAVNWWPST